MIPPALVAAIADAAPDDPSARLVAADHLQQQPDPAARAHGELIAAMVRTPDDRDRIESLIHDATGEPGDLFGWRWGFRERIASTLRAPADFGAVRARLAHPASCVVRGLAIDSPDRTFVDDALAFAIGTAAPTLRSLRISGYASNDGIDERQRAMFPDDPEFASDLADHDPAWPALPQLTELRYGLFAARALRPLPALVDARLDVVLLDDLAALVAPNLTHLRFAGIADLDDRLATLALANLPALTHLALARGTLPIAQLLAMPVVRRLQRFEVVAGVTGERPRRFFPVDRAPRALDGLLDLGLTPTSKAGAFVKLDDYRGRLDLGDTHLEHTGVDWWLRDAPPNTWINGGRLEDVRVIPGDELAADGRVFRAVGSDEDLAALRARTYLYS